MTVHPVRLDFSLQAVLRAEHDIRRRDLWLAQLFGRDDAGDGQAEHLAVEGDVRR